MRKIKKGDEIVVLSGRDKGKRGKVLHVTPAADTVTVENINMIKKHVKPNPQLKEAGGIVEQPRPMPVCKVAVYNPISKKADRVGFKLLGDGRKVRYFKSDGEILDA